MKMIFTRIAAAIGLAALAGVSGMVYPFLLVLIWTGSFLDSFRMIYWRRPGRAVLADAARHLVIVPVFWTGLYGPGRAAVLAASRLLSQDPLPPAPRQEILEGACGLLVAAGALAAAARLRRAPGGSGLPLDSARGGPAATSGSRGQKAPPTPALADLVVDDVRRLVPDWVRRRISDAGRILALAAVWAASCGALLIWEVPRLDPANWSDEEVRRYALLPVQKTRFLGNLANGDAAAKWEAVQVLLGAASDDATVKAAVRRKLVAWFREGSEDDRARAVRYLGTMGYDDPDIAPMLKDRERQYHGIAQRDAAVFLLVRTMGGEAKTLIPDLVTALKRGYPDTRAFAAAALAAVGADPAAAVPLLREALKDKEPAVRLEAVKGLAAYGHAAREMAPDLRAALQDPGWAVIRQEAAAALLKLSPDADSAVALLKDFLKSDDRDFRISVVRAAPAAGAAAVPVLVAALKDGDRYVRWAVLEAFGEIGPAAAGAVNDILPVPFAQDEPWEDRMTRKTAVQSLLKIGLPLVLERLDDPDAGLRTRAEGVLGYMGYWEPVDGLPRLINAMNHRSPAVRRAIADVLGRYGWLGSAETVRPLVARALEAARDGDADPEVRALARLGLWKLDALPSPPIDVLVAALKDSNGRIREKAVKALQKAGPEARAAVPALTEALADGQWPVPVVAVEILQSLKADARPAVPALLGVIRDAKSSIRQRALGALSEIAEPATLPALWVEFLADKDLGGYALNYLEKIPSAEAGARLVEALGDAGRRAAVVKGLAAARWRRLKMVEEESARIVPLLVRTLKEEGDRDARVATVGVLAMLGPKAAEAAPALIEGLADGERWVRAGCAGALGTIGRAAAGAVPALTARLKDADDGVRQSAATALGGFGAEAAPAVPVLAELLGHDDRPWVRRAAAEALGRIGPAARDAVPALAAALRSGSTYEGTDVPGYAASALMRIGPDARAAVPALIETLGDSNETVRGNAALALGHVGPDAAPAVPALARALRDSAAYVRGHAATALGLIGPAAKDAIPALEEALKAEAAGGPNRYYMSDALRKIRK